jgi:hypothetical protein
MKESMNVKIDTCLFYGKEILDPKLVRSEFIKLNKGENFEIAYEIKPFIKSHISLDIDIPFFLNDSILKTVENDTINTSWFLEANNMTVSWEGIVNKNSKNVSKYVAIINSTPGW